MIIVICHIVYIKNRVLKLRFLVFSSSIRAAIVLPGHSLIRPIQGINKEIRGFPSNLVGYVFPKKLGLDSKITSWDLKNRIPREKLYILTSGKVTNR